MREDGNVEVASAKPIVYSASSRHLYEEAEELQVEHNSSVQPQLKRGWRTYNFEVEELHNYIAGGYLVHNDSLGDLLSAENQYANLYGVAFNPDDPVAVQRLADAVANGTVDGGVLAESIGPNGDTGNLVARILTDDDEIVDTVSDAQKNVTFIDSQGSQVTLNTLGQEISELTPNVQSGSTTVTFGYSSNGTQFLETETNTDSAGNTISKITNTNDPTTGLLQSFKQTNYDASGNKTQDFTTDANENITSYDEYNSDGSYTHYIFNNSGEVDTATQYSTDGNFVAQQNFTYDEGGNIEQVNSANSDGSSQVVQIDQKWPTAERLRRSQQPRRSKRSDDRRYHHQRII